MSRETIAHLNTNVLVGMTDKRGNAWHYKADEQGDESNHYAGAIPVADVNRRLFHWTADPRPVLVSLPATLDQVGDDGVTLDATGSPVLMRVLEDRQAITRSDTGDVFGIFKSGYVTHQYSEWLLDTVSSILGDTLVISSAGLLKQGAVAWVEVSVPDTVTTPEGVTFRPNLLAVTSHDGSIATTYKRTVTNTVCDNTMAMAMSEQSEQVKIRHSKYSKAKITEVRDALNLVQETGDVFMSEVARLSQTVVTPKQWQAFLDTLSPIGEDKGRGQTLAIAKQDELNRLWKNDNRVSPWTGTAWGVVQAVNTYAQHSATVKNMSRADRNMMSTVKGEFDTLDRETFGTLSKILANA